MVSHIFSCGSLCFILLFLACFLRFFLRFGSVSSSPRKTSTAPASPASSPKTATTRPTTSRSGSTKAKVVTRSTTKPLRQPSPHSSETKDNGKKPSSNQLWHKRVSTTVKKVDTEHCRGGLLLCHKLDLMTSYFPIDTHSTLLLPICREAIVTFHECVFGEKRSSVANSRQLHERNRCFASELLNFF